MSGGVSIARALDCFVSLGWTRAHAAGLVANLQAESGLRPDAVGDGGLAYGIAQWHPDRQANFERAFGKSIKSSTLDEQLAFVHWELQNTEKRAGDALRECATAADAGACVSRMYERPKDREGEAGKRAALATQIFREHAGAADPAANIPGNIPTPAPAPPTATPPVPSTQPVPTTKEPRMGAAFISAFLPTIFELFSGRAAAAVQKVSGASPDVSSAFVKTMAQKVEDLSGATVTDNATALKAVAAVVDDPVKMQELQDHALDYLDKVGPLLDKLAAHELALAKQADDSADRAAARVKSYPPEVVKLIAKDSEKLTQGLVGMLVLAVIAEVIFSPDHRPGAATLTLIGPLLTLVLRDRSNIVRAVYGGAAESTVINAGDTAVRAAIPPAKT